MTDASRPERRLTSYKLSVNVSAEVGQLLRRTAFEERLSESSIVQVALTELFEDVEETSLGEFLRERGASLRREKVEAGSSLRT